MTSKPKQEELRARLDTFLNNSDWGVTLFAGHRDVLVKNIATFINSEVTSVLDEAIKAINKEIKASKNNLQYAIDHKQSDTTIKNWKGCIEGEKFAKQAIQLIRSRYE